MSFAMNAFVVNAFVVNAFAMNAFASESSIHEFIFKNVLPLSLTMIIHMI